MSAYQYCIDCNKKQRHSHCDSCAACCAKRRTK